MSMQVTTITRAQNEAERPKFRVWALMFIVLSTLYYLAGIHASTGSSDGATVVLEAHSLVGGNFMLRGWSLSLDSFWTVDALIYAPIVLILGIGRELLFLVPAFIASGVTLVGVWLTSEGRKSVAIWPGGAVLAILIAIPSPYLASFLVQGPLHIGTTLWCLLAIILLRNCRFGWQWLLAVVLLAAGILGDFLTVALGILPVGIAGLLIAIRHRRFSKGAAPIAASGAACLLALVVRMIAVTIGTFGIRRANPLATSPLRMLGNVGYGLKLVTELFGIGSGNGLSAGPIWLELFRVVAFVGVVITLCVGIFAMVASVTKSRYATYQPTRRSTSESIDPHFVDNALILGTGGSACIFIGLAVNSSATYGRYLVPGIIFVSILTGRMAARTFEGLHHSVRHGRSPKMPSIAMAVIASVGAVSFIGFGAGVLQHGPPDPESELISYLSSHHLTTGVGGYWTASLTTVDSGGHILVRPVVERNGSLERYQRQSDASWYTNQRFTFVVFDTQIPWGGVDAAIASSTFGTPASTVDVGPYVVLTYPSGFSVSASIPPA